MFYENVQELCKKHGTTLTAVVRELGLANSLPTKWKNGSKPNAETILKLSTYFGVSVELLMEDDRDAFISATNSVVVSRNSGSISVGSTQLSDMEQEILRIFRLLDMRDKNRVMSYLYNIEDELKK